MTHNATNSATTTLPHCINPAWTVFNGHHDHTCCNLCTPIKDNNNGMNKSLLKQKNVNTNIMTTVTTMLEYCTNPAPKWPHQHMTPMLLLQHLHTKTPPLSLHFDSSRCSIRATTSSSPQCHLHNAATTMPPQQHQLAPTQTLMHQCSPTNTTHAMLWLQHPIWCHQINATYQSSKTSMQPQQLRCCNTLL
jgi:hypothetical protein